MPSDPGLQIDLVIRLAAAALLGAVVGLEREFHGHEAGMRTHMLVSLGSAIFTVLSIYGFPQVPGTAATDPSRIAAQVVTGIGFLGAGAILKYGTNVRGLTTAASLWVVAAVGLACGAGSYLVAVAGTLMAVVSLWPLHLLVQRAELRGVREIRVRLLLARLDAFAAVSQVLVDHRVEIVGITSETSDAGQQMEMLLRVPRPALVQRLMAELAQLPDVHVRTMSSTEEA